MQNYFWFSSRDGALSYEDKQRYPVLGATHYAKMCYRPRDKEDMKIQTCRHGMHMSPTIVESLHWASYAALLWWVSPVGSRDRWYMEKGNHQRKLAAKGRTYRACMDMREVWDEIASEFIYESLSVLEKDNSVPPSVMEFYETTGHVVRPAVVKWARKIHRERLKIHGVLSDDPRLMAAIMFRRLVDIYENASVGAGHRYDSYVIRSLLTRKWNLYSLAERMEAEKYVHSVIKKYGTEQCGRFSAKQFK